MHTANLQITPLAPARPIRTQIDPRTEPDDPTGYAIFMSQILYIIHRKSDTSDTSQILEYRNVIWVIKSGNSHMAKKCEKVVTQWSNVLQ